MEDFLTVDIGNTNFKFSVFHSEKVIQSFISNDISSLIEIMNRNKDITLIFSSVAPNKTNELLELLNKYNVKSFQIDNESSSLINFPDDYKSSIGIDRICSLEGALYLEKQKDSKFDFLTTIDFGTATTINIIDSKFNFIGGTISPGIMTMFKSLNFSTELLPLIDEIGGYTLVGTNTKSNIVNGVLNAQIGMIEKVLINYKGFNKVYITGGNAKSIMKYLSGFNFEFNEVLNQYGLLSMYKSFDSANF